MTLICTK